MKNGIAVYSPFVDDEKVDLIVRIAKKNQVQHWGIQVKSSKEYNAIIGILWKYIATKPPDYLLVIAYIYSDKPDEFFFLTIDDLLELMPKPVSEWGEIRFNKQEREKYANQTINNLVRLLMGDQQG